MSKLALIFIPLAMSAQYLPPGGGSSGGGPNVTQGAYTSIPSTCTTNDLYYITNSYYTLRCSATNTWSYFIDGHVVKIAGPASNWTLVSNSGTAAAADSKGAVVISTTGNVTGGEVLVRALPSTPYVITDLFNVVADGGNIGGASLALNCGVFWSSGAVVASELLGGMYDFANGPSNFRVLTGHINNTDVANIFGPVGASMSGNKAWVQLADDGTTKTLAYSADGVNFLVVLSTPHATTITPADYGFGCYGWNGTGHAWRVSLLAEVSGAI